MSEYRFDQIAIVSTEKKKPTDADKENYIGLEHLSPDTFDVVDYGSEVAPKGEKLVMRKGDVLFGKRRAYQKKVGIAPCDGIFSAHGMVLRPNEEVIDARFFPFFIKSDAFLDEAIRISVGSLSPTVNWRDLRELRFNLPPIERQKELADLLWAGEDLRSTYRRLLDACGEQVKSRFIEMFGTIDETPYEVVTIQDLCEPIKDGTHQTPTYAEGPDDGVAFLSSKDVVTGRIDWTNIKYITHELHDELYRRIAPRKGDVLLAKNGTTGVCAIVDRDAVFDLYVTLALLRPLDGINSHYLWAAVNSDRTKAQFDSRLKGVGVPNLHLKEIKETRVVKPPYILQREFASFVSQVDKSEYLARCRGPCERCESQLVTAPDNDPDG